MIVAITLFATLILEIVIFAATFALLIVMLYAVYTLLWGD